MPLRTLLGEGPPEILEQQFSVLNRSQIFLLGTRDLDAAEGQFIRQNSLSLFSSKQINQRNNKSVISAIKEQGFSKLYIHLDLDVLDSKEFSWIACPTPKGTELSSICQLLKDLDSEF